jgi:hypothetical protein
MASMITTILSGILGSWIASTGQPRAFFSCQSGFFNLKLNQTCRFEKHANPNSLNKIMLQVLQ